MVRRTRHAPGVVGHELAGEILLLAPGQQSALHLDEVATAAWRLLDGAPTHLELVEAMIARYAVSAEQVSGDLAALLATLLQHGVAIELEGP